MRFSARRVMMTTLSALMAVAVLGLSAAPSSADAITDKKAQAAQIAQELAHLSAKIDLLGQQYDAAQEKMAADNRPDRGRGQPALGRQPPARAGPPRPRRRTRSRPTSTGTAAATCPTSC